MDLNAINNELNVIRDLLDELSLEKIGEIEKKTGKKKANVIRELARDLENKTNALLEQADGTIGIHDTMEYLEALIELFNHSLQDFEAQEKSVQEHKSKGDKTTPSQEGAIAKAKAIQQTMYGKLTRKKAVLEEIAKEYDPSKFISRQEEKIEAAEAEANRIIKKKKEFEEAKKDNKSSLAKIDKLLKKIKKKENEITTLTLTAHEQRTKKEFEDKEKEVEAAQQEIEKLIQEIQSLETQKDTLEAEKTALEADKTLLEARKTTLEEDKRKLEEDKRKLEEEQTRLENEIKAEQNKGKKKDATKIAQLESEKAQIQRQLQTNSENLIQTVAGIQTNTNAISQKEADIQSKGTQISSLEREISTKQTACSNHDAVRTAANNYINDSQNKSAYDAVIKKEKENKKMPKLEKEKDKMLAELDGVCEIIFNRFSPVKGRYSTEIIDDFRKAVPRLITPIAFACSIQEFFDGNISPAKQYDKDFNKQIENIQKAYKRIEQIKYAAKEAGKPIGQEAQSQQTSGNGTRKNSTPTHTDTNANGEIDISKALILKNMTSKELKEEAFRHAVESKGRTYRRGINFLVHPIMKFRSWFRGGQMVEEYRQNFIRKEEIALTEDERNKARSAYNVGENNFRQELWTGVKAQRRENPEITTEMKQQANEKAVVTIENELG